MFANVLQISEGNCRHKQIFKLIINNNKMKTNFKLKNQLIAFAYVLLVAVLFTSCKKTTDNQTVFAEEKQTENIVRVGGGNDVYVTEVDSCEYLIFDGYKAGGIIHKQNCKFCLARNDK